VQAADDVDQGARREDRGEPLALLRQESLRLLVGAPIAQVGLGVSDIEIADDEELPPPRRGRASSRDEVTGEAGEERHLALVLGAVVRLATHAAGDL